MNSRGVADYRNAVNGIELMSNEGNAGSTSKQTNSCSDRFDLNEHLKLLNIESSMTETDNLDSSPDRSRGMNCTFLGI